MGCSTSEYRISRYDLARLATEEYLRTFWWLAAIVPSFGIITLILSRGILQIIGYLALLWPFTIPARAILSTSKAARLFLNGTRMTCEDDTIFFHAKDGKGLKLQLDSVRGTVQRRGFTLIQFRSWNPVPLPAFIPIPNSAFADESTRLAFIARIQNSVSARD